MGARPIPKTFRLRQEAATALSRFVAEEDAPPAAKVISDAVVAYCAAASTLEAEVAWAACVKDLPADVRAKLARAMATGAYGSCAEAIVDGLRGRLKNGRDPSKQRAVMGDRKQRVAQWKAINVAAQAHLGIAWPLTPIDHDVRWDYYGGGTYHVTVVLPWVPINQYAVELPAPNVYVATGKAALLVARHCGLSPQALYALSAEDAQRVKIR